MPVIQNLPGVFPELQDGNLAVLDAADAPTVLVIGTAEDGPSERLVPINRTDEALATFKRGGTLARGCLEVKKAGATNVFAYRIGATPAQVTWIGNAAHVAGKGITIITVEKDDDIADNYFVSWDDDESRLRIWDAADELVFDNDSTNPVDAGELIVFGDTDDVTGPSFGTQYTGIQMSTLDDPAIVPGGNIVYTAGTDGTYPTRQELFEHLQDAYRALEGVRADIIVPMDVYLDDLNIADDATLEGTTEDFLGWFKETEEDDGSWTYEWDDAAAKPADYHEVNFAYQLANFCHQLTTNEWAAIGVIGVKPYRSKAAADVATWIGKLPTTDSAGNITTNGTGLLGNKFMSGKIGWDPGFFATESEFLDGDVVLDRLDHNVDIGKYLSVVAQWSIHYNSFDLSGFGYTSSAVTEYAALISLLDSKSAPTNKVVGSLTSLPVRIAKVKLDRLAGAKYVMFMPKDRGAVVVDAPTAATSESDWQRLTTTRIVTDVLRVVREIGDPFIGEAQTQATREALKAAVERRLGEMKKLGYIQGYACVVSATANQAVQGYCVVELVIIPAFELRRITLIVSLAKE